MRQILPFSSQVAPVQKTARAQVFGQPTFRANAACSRVALDDRAVQETFGPFTFFFAPLLKQAELAVSFRLYLSPWEEFSFTNRERTWTLHIHGLSFYARKHLPGTKLLSLHTHQPS